MKSLIGLLKEEDNKVNRYNENEKSISKYNDWINNTISEAEIEYVNKQIKILKKENTSLLDNIGKIRKEIRVRINKL